MRLPGDEEIRSSGLMMKYMMVGISLCLLMIVGAVFYTNKEAEEKRRQERKESETVMALEHESATQSQEETVQSDMMMVSGEESAIVASRGKKSMEEIEKLYKENKLTAEDLDFWDMYQEEEAVPVYTEKDGEEEEEKKDLARYEAEAAEELESDPSRDGKHTLVKLADGTEEWVKINTALKQHSYDFTKLTMQSDKMAYYDSGKKTSYLGVDLSKDNGDINFKRLKEAGVDFVMLRAGSRGYGSGEIQADEKFQEYMTKATEAGLFIGVYFYSQAITTSEAVKEAEFVLEQIGENKITYPVVFDMEYIHNDTARIDNLSVGDKTNIAKAFLDKVEDKGFHPMIYGNKEWLLKEIDLSRLTGYDIWLSQQEDMPDYPYLFQMWQYSFDGKLNGIDGKVNLNISFTDYSIK